MCVDDTQAEYDEPVPDPANDPVLNPRPPHPSRRVVLSAMAGLAVAPFVVAPFVSTGGAAAASSGQTLTGLVPVNAAMHVHGAWSEGTGSWEAQFAQAAAVGIDLLHMTDHDFRARAYNYMTSLKGVPMVTSVQGSLGQHASTLTG